MIAPVRRRRAFFLLPTSASLLQLSSRLWSRGFHDHFADLDSKSVEEVADVLVRLAVSRAVLPSADIATTGARIRGWRPPPRRWLADSRDLSGLASIHWTNGPFVGMSG